MWMYLTPNTGQTSPEQARPLPRLDKELDNSGLPVGSAGNGRVGVGGRMA